jgi:hypothetical protein
MDKWEERAAYEQEGINTLEKIRRNYDKVSQFVNGGC